MASPKNKSMATPERSEFRAAFYVEKTPADRKKLDAAKRAAEIATQNQRGGAVNPILRVVLFAVIVIGGIAAIISLRDFSGFFGIH
ncbi:MAG: hypothetical protein EXR02_02170 [Rhodospirillales bacterium]|nr:hypothetical protein [Rhodospirillales bacterium]